MNRSIFQLWQPFIKNSVFSKKQIKTLNFNFGPQHPAAHGVLRLVLQLNGEVIEKTDPHIGLLHRGTEKLMETKNYLKSLPYFDRFDYVSMLIQEHAYCLGVEYLMQKQNFSSTLSQIRTLYDELTRVLNHMLAIGCHALDVGSMSSLFWAFEEREKIMEFYERVSGARMHAAFYRPCEINYQAVTPDLTEDIVEFCKNCSITLNEMHNVLTFNKIWKQRLVNVCNISYTDCLDYGLTGVMSRSSGIKRDLRLNKTETYSNYYFLNFRSYTGLNGDAYDRYLIRMNEMLESLNIVNQVVYKTTVYIDNELNKKKLKNKVNFSKIINYITNKSVKCSKLYNEYNTMEKLINHFKYWSEGPKVTSGFTYQSVESPKGEFGVTLLSDSTNKPYRCKVRSPAYHSLQAFPIMTKGHFLADLITAVGTVDIVFGEIDR